MCHMVFKVYALWKSCFTLKTGICLYKNFLAYKVFEVTDLCKSCFALAVEWLLHSVGAQMYFHITFLWKFCSTHLYGFSPVWICICSFIPLFCEHFAAHLSQMFAFFLVFLSLWYLKYSSVKILLHIHDICTARPKYQSECVLLCFRSVKIWHHTPGIYMVSPKYEYAYAFSVECWVFGNGCWMLSVECLVMGVGCWVLSVVCWVLSVEC